MTQINPYAGAIVQSTQVQRQQAAHKDRQMRRAQEMTRNIAAEDDLLQHSVESSDGLRPIQEQRKENHPQRRPPHHPLSNSPDESPEQQEPPRLDLTA